MSPPPPPRTPGQRAPSTQMTPPTHAASCREKGPRTATWCQRRVQRPVLLKTPPRSRRENPCSANAARAPCTPLRARGKKEPRAWDSTQYRVSWQAGFLPVQRPRDRKPPRAVWRAATPAAPSRVQNLLGNVRRAGSLARHHHPRFLQGAGTVVGMAHGHACLHTPRWKWGEKHSHVPTPPRGRAPGRRAGSAMRAASTAARRESIAHGIPPPLLPRPAPASGLPARLPQAQDVFEAPGDRTAIHIPLPLHRIVQGRQQLGHLSCRRGSGRMVQPRCGAALQPTRSPIARAS